MVEPLPPLQPGGAGLAAAWEQHARQWIVWARAEGHDSYWRFHRDQFLELLPPPGRATLDLGCGEGRLARDLKALGHHVTAIDASMTMVASARAADPAIDVLHADAAALPFADESFDCVVAFMSLQDVDDLDGAISESSRVLVPEGVLCLAIVHPLNSAGGFVGDGGAAPFVIAGSYVDEFAYTDVLSRDGLEMTFISAHRSLERYTEALAEEDFLIERVRERAMPESAIRDDNARRWQRLPLFLHLRARKLPSRRLEGQGRE